MIHVKYEEYTNDYCRRYMDKRFYSLGEFEDWFFSMCDGKYEDKIFIPNPDRKDIWGDGPSRMEVNCMWTKNKCFWVHQIEDGVKIVFSDGKHTNGQRHWNEELQNLCRHMLERQKKPRFSFG